MTVVRQGIGRKQIAILLLGLGLILIGVLGIAGVL
jgi:hypothetical protein